MSPKVSTFVFSAVAILFTCAIAHEEVHAEVQEAAKGKAATVPQITMGNGKRNSIQMQGMTRAEGVTQFSESRVNNGVTSRFRGDSVADPGRRFMVMLHSDVDKDRILDFVFVEDGINVEDTAVLEGTTLVGHVFAVPE